MKQKLLSYSSLQSEVIVIEDKYFREIINKSHHIKCKPRAAIYDICQQRSLNVIRDGVLHY